MTKLEDSNGWFDAAAIPTPSAAQHNTLTRTMVNDNAPYQPDTNVDHLASSPLSSVKDDSGLLSFPAASALSTSNGIFTLLAYIVLVFISGLYFLHMIAIIYGFVPLFWSTKVMTHFAGNTDCTRNRKPIKSQVLGFL